MASALAERLIEYRRGRAEDLGAVNAIFHEAQTDGEASPPPLSRTGLPIFPHELAHGEFWVATDAEEVVGFGATVERAGIAFLAELFVRRERRSHGIGHALVERCFGDRGRPRMTMSSPDPRALALYVRLGLEPRWPLIYLVRSPGSLRRGFRVGDDPSPQGEEVGGGDEVVEMDAEISGRRRPEDFAYWRDSGEARFLRFANGYAVVRHRSDDWVGNEDAITIGPVGARSANDAVAAVVDAVESVLASGKKIRLGVPAPHPVLRELLARGFAIAELDTFLATPGPLTFDPACYVPSGGALF